MKIDENSTNVMLGVVKEGDIVCYPLGFSLCVKKVYADEKGDLYVKQFVNDKVYPRYIYKKMDGYKWDTRLCIEMGFRLAKENELQYLEDYVDLSDIRDLKIEKILQK